MPLAWLGDVLPLFHAQQLLMRRLAFQFELDKAPVLVDQLAAQAGYAGEVQFQTEQDAARPVDAPGGAGLTQRRRQALLAPVQGARRQGMGGEGVLLLHVQLALFQQPGNVQGASCS